ncbi:amino acid adenylation domain-containing protein [Flavobacterium sp. LS1R49]|uniref:Amino acid adenylation domain-containing protein n=1 Tax=Flavobacterium shii TaxID=2987687 RepID=A0A9X3C5R6_9FLAO|nr:non-ribosomal peptide synthetase [Flavobacterium shii]MCV9927837.1 amino acid adenylation domain-containing protein [Flavobacterium shii]
MNKKIIHTVFENIVKNHGSNIALQGDKGNISYHELNKYSNKLAHLLLNAKISKNDIATVYFSDPRLQVISLLGAFKSGAIYLPIDKKYKRNHWEELYTTIRPKVYITAAEDLALLHQFSDSFDYFIPYIITLSIDSHGALHYKLYENSKDTYVDITRKGHLSDENPELQLEDNDPNYIYFTSGSTGNPKAVLGCHKSLSHFVHWECTELGIKESDKVGLLPSFSFDASIQAIFMALINGSTLCLINSETKEDIIQLQNWIRKYNITVLHMVPTLFRILSIYSEGEINSLSFPDLKYILLAGEKLYQKDVENWRECHGSNTEIINFYGTTEATILSTFYRIEAELYGESSDVFCVGQPISNTVILILNKDNKLCKIGEVGSIYIKTPFLTKGYYKNPVLTAEKFMQNPLSASTDIIYKTGDYGKYDSQRNTIVTGREDGLVKINGVRIDINTIEQTILKLKEVGMVKCLTYQQDLLSVILVCFYKSASVDENEIRKHCLEYLSQYEVPSRFIALDEVPINANGKIDPVVLKKIIDDTLRADSNEATDENEANETEKKLIQIWKEILNVEKIRLNDNYLFLGGNSIKLIQLKLRIQQKFDVELSIYDLFSNSILKEQAELIAQSKKSVFEYITKAQTQEYYNLSSTQYRMWVLSQIESSSIAYNMPNAFLFKGEVDVLKLNESFRNIIERHEILRTFFKSNEEGEVHQYIKPIHELEFDIAQKDFTNSNSIEEIKPYLFTLNAEPFNLEQSPLLRAYLIKVNENEHVFYFTMHHIIGDGWSSLILFKEIISTYNSLLKNEKSELGDLNVQYKDYVTWSQNEIHIEKNKISAGYWLDQFSGELPALELPGFKKRPLIKTNNGNKIEHVYSTEFTQKLKSFSEAQNVTLFMTLMAGINTLLARYSGQDDIIIGTPVAGREHPSLENQIGPYLNTVAIRTKLDVNESFNSLLIKEKQLLLNSYEHQSYPFDELVWKLDLKQDNSRSFLFDVLVVLQNQNQVTNLDTKEELSGLKIESVDFENNSSKFDLTFNFIETENLNLSITYNTDIYDQFLIEEMFSHFENLLGQLAAQPDTAVGKADYLTEAEKKQLLSDFNDTSVEYPSHKTIVDLFEEQVEKTPNGIAIRFNDIELTYKELNEKANQFAHYLHESYEIQANDIIGIKLNRGEKLIVSILGVLKSGGAYVPIDPAYPQNRIEYIEKDSACKIVIDDSFLGLFTGIYEQYSKENITNKDLYDNLSYVIYTSGSTGNPKGVMIKHGSLFNYIEWAREHYLDSELANTDFGLFSSLSFDLTITSLFLPIVSGGCLNVFGPNEDVLDILKDYFNGNISCIKITPAHINALENLDINASKVEVAIVGGEALTQKQIQILKGVNPAMRIYNEYGPTETTVGCIVSEITSPDENILIGKPISNTSIYILDQFENLQPKGIVGEIYIGGSGLSKGYLNRPDLMSDKFIENSYKKGESLYKSGDLGRWMPNGDIDYIGRIDDQVKIRGYRIELAEIEKNLSLIPGVSQSIVVVIQKNDDKYLTAYYVSETHVDKKEIKSSLSKVLPEYMVPSYYVELESLPLTSNGKINKKALPEISEQDIIRKEYVAPRNETEEKLAEIWQEMLKVDKIGVTDNFFNLGGHSLLVVRIINQIKKDLGLNISVKTFFENPTIDALSEQLKDKKTESFFIEKVAESDSYPVTASQNKFWLISQFEDASVAYNMLTVFRLEGDLVIPKFKESFIHLMDRHESLRTSFKLNKDEELRQFITATEDLDFSINYTDFSLSKSTEEDVASYVLNENAIRFDLEKAPLVRASLIKVEEGKFVFFISMHHIIGDGWSSELLVGEVVSIYNSLVLDRKVDLPELRIQYKDYAAWLNNEVQKEGYKISEQYWLNQFSGKLPVLELPGSKKRPSLKTYNGDYLGYQFSEVFSENLRDFSNKNHVSLFMVLTAGIKTLLSRYTGQEDIIIGTPVAGREHPDLENQIGLYLNTLALRTQINKEYNFLELLHHEKEVILGAYEHQIYPFDELIDKLQLKRDTSKSLLFDILVVLHNQTKLNKFKDEKLVDLFIKPYESSHKTSQFDLSFRFSDNEALYLEINYNTDIYDKSFVEKVFKHFETLVSELIAKPEAKLVSIEFLSEKDKNEMAMANYWKGMFQNEFPTIILPFEKQTLKESDKPGSQFQFNISEELKERLLKFSNSGKGTLFTSLLFLLKITIRKYIDNDLVALCVSFPEEKSNEGHKLDLPIVTTIDNEELLQDIYNGLNRGIEEIKENLFADFQMAEKVMNAFYENNEENIFNIKCNYYKNQAPENSLYLEKTEGQDFTSNIIFTDNIISIYNMSFDFYENETGINCVLIYNNGMYDKSHIMLFIERFNAVINQLVENPELFSQFNIGNISFDFQSKKQPNKNKILLEENF